MNKQDKQILAITAAARKQTDPVKRGKIVDKIRQIKSNIARNNWLGQ